MDCFVIMPYGERADAQGKMINFDLVYSEIIEKSVKRIKNLTCIRCDRIEEAGPIHPRMFAKIYESAVAIVDITSLNPNVFYELGLRHVLADSVTVIIKREGTNIPFNISHINAIDYNEKSDATIKQAIAKISSFIKNGLDKRKSDSPIYDHLKIKLAIEEDQLTRRQVYPYRLKVNREKNICLVTGDLYQMKNIADIWVNSENTNMQMARHYDRSVSGAIRFWGAEKDGAHVTKDTIAEQLIKYMDGRFAVDPGSVIATGAGELEQSHGVKRIFHVASVIGQPGEGFRPIQGIDRCIYHALQKVDAQFADSGFTSVLFPLMGTGTGRGSLEELAPKLISRAISYLHDHPASKVEKVFFVTRTPRELEVCRRVLRGTKEVIAERQPR